MGVALLCSVALLGSIEPLPSGSQTAYSEIENNGLRLYARAASGRRLRGARPAQSPSRYATKRTAAAMNHIRELARIVRRSVTEIRRDARHVETLDRLRHRAYAVICEYRSGRRET